MINKNIFRKYDIRGIIDKDLHYNDAIEIGKSIATICIEYHIETVSIGRDGRMSSPKLFENLTEGLISSGINVINMGVLPTPCLYYSVHNLNLKAGIMITGSHNPKDYNGFKIMLKDKSFFGDDIENLYNIITKNAFKKLNKIGIISEKDIKESYINEITSFIKKEDNLNICFDAGNGVTGDILREISKRINVSDENLLFCEIDGSFPNHHPDPTIASNMIDLSNLVKKKNAKIGIAFDGDGDRVGIVDDKGNFISGDILMCILSKELLKKEKKATIIADVKASKILFDEIKKYGGNALMWKTGHSLIKDKMKKENALLAGEMSGHIFYKDRYYGYDDGLYSAMRIIEIIQNNVETISDMISKLPKMFNNQEKKIEVSDEKKFDIMEKVKKYIIKNYKNVNQIDGVRVDLENGWFLIRASNTQNCLITRCEAESDEELKKIEKLTQDILKQFL